MYVESNTEARFCRGIAISITSQCVCVCTLARACAFARVALLIQHVTRMRHIVSSFVASLAPQHFSTFSHKRHDFRGGGGSQ